MQSIFSWDEKTVIFSSKFIKFLGLKELVG